MAGKYVHTEIEGYKLKLSNLDKVLYPEGPTVKAEIIQYYMSVAPYFLKHVANRPLTLIRFPDGIDGTKFYSKSCPEWAPKWIGREIIIHSSKEPTPYAVVNNTAGVIWLANLAALEIHPMQMTVDRMELPDHFIFDIDPPEGSDFAIVKEIAYKLKDFLESYNYTPFIKTSGGKGVHIIVPILTQYSHEEMVESVKNLAKLFVQQNKKSSTLNMQKESRQGKTLIDIYRNHKAQTTVAPYSLRAKPHAPVSTPILWSQLGDIASSQHFNIKNIQAHLAAHGDLWADIAQHAAPLHDRIEQSAALQEKLQEKLGSYLSKRDFGKTPEPAPKPLGVDQNRFCIQLHNASNLHYDLRLEEEGVLLSWAIPKGLPHKKGVKRLAIQTENHPMEYLTFEGMIPAGEYGAGQMWIFALGKIKWIKRSPTYYKFELDSPQFKGSFSLFKTERDGQWLIERKDEEEAKILNEKISPMLAGVAHELPHGYEFIYEIKWDGIRTIIFVDDGKVWIQSRSGRDITSQFPELQNVDAAFHIENGIFDGEIISMDEKGRPIFADVISRLHTAGSKAIEIAQSRNPVYCYLYDCLYLDGRNIMSEPLTKRQAWLKVSMKKHNHYRISETMTDGKALYDAAKAMDLEGVMAKYKDRPYVVGRRIDNWLKIKFRQTHSCIIIGYTKGKGDRVNEFGAMHLAEREGEEWKYLGKVGTGFDRKKLEEIFAKLSKLEVLSKYIEETIEEPARTVWVAPELYCEVQFASWTNKKTLREPVFMHFREDLA